VDRARERNPGAKVKRFSERLVEDFKRKPWPGNVRELENTVERIVIVCPEEVADLDDFEACQGAATADVGAVDFGPGGFRTLREMEDEYIAWVTRQCGGNKTHAAEVLGIDVSTIHRRERGAVK
jgi:two-component system, NtrC family, response regulator HydG